MVIFRKDKEEVMEKHVLISVSPYVQKYYINDLYEDLPQDIKETLRAKLGVIAEKTNAIISLGFYENGEIFMEQRYEDLSFYDEIGAELRIKKFQKDEAELLKAVKMWYVVYHTPNGAIVREIVVLQSQNKSNDEIVNTIVATYGETFRDFVIMLLEG